MNNHQIKQAKKLNLRVFDPRTSTLSDKPNSLLNNIRQEVLRVISSSRNMKGR